jgi:soluble lytic murein transglycosylase-like protein
VAVPRFSVTPEALDSFEADRWQSQQLNQIADEWAAKTSSTFQPPTPSASLTNPLVQPAPVPAPPPPPEPLPTPPPRPVAAIPQAADETVSNPFGEAFRQLGGVVSGARDSVASALTSTFNPQPDPTLAQPQQSPQASSSSTPLPTGDYVDYARGAAQRAGIDPDLFVRQINQESGFNPGAGSPAGAQGIAQIVPQYHPGVDPSDPYASLDYAARLMKSHLETYGGDIRKALVAYNGGGGAVQAMDAGRIYDESRQYLERILGGGGAPTPAGSGQTAASVPGATASLSQFGDKALTADEAYAACGPAAAVRLAALYGNAIPLKVALDAAKQVGWTQGAGMAGISSEKKLMDALGLPAELDTSGNTDRILSEAGAGRMVTISTAGHYFSASGARQRANGDTELYVGQSGADLRNGKPWMTLAEMTAVMGPIGGALFSDPSKAVAAGEFMQTASQQHGSPLETPEEALGQLAAAKQKVAPAVVDETTTNPFGEAFRQAGIAKDAVGGAIGDTLSGAGQLKDQAGQAVSSGLGAAKDYAAGGVAQVQNPNSDNPLYNIGGTAASALGTAAHDVTQRMRDLTPSSGAARTVAGLDQQSAELAKQGYPQLEAELNSLIDRQDAGEPGLQPRMQELSDQMNAITRGISTNEAMLGAAERNPNLPVLETAANIGASALAAPLAAENAPMALRAAASVIDPMTGLPAVAGRALESAGPVLRGRARGELNLDVLTGKAAAAQDAARAAQPVTQGSTANNTLLNMYGKVQSEAGNPIPGRIEEARRDFVRAWTDRGIDLAEFQKDAQKAVGRPLTADEMAYEMRRLNPAGAAQMRVQNELKPAIQSVGKDADWLRVYLTHKDNIDVGKAMGNVDRSFSGGLSAADSEAGLVDMAQQLGPERMAKVEQAGQQIVDYGKSLLQRKVDAGLISQDLFDDLTTKYPNYSPTRITDYLKDPAGIPSGKKLSVTDAGLKRNTIEGTVRQREDPLASFVRLGYETEALATKNETAQAFLKLRELNPDAKMMIQKVADDAANPRGYEKMKVFENGVPQTYQMPSYMAKAIKEEPVAAIPILTPLMNMFRMAATQRNPLFLASNALNDAASYTLRTSSRMGGPQHVPKIAVELVKAYGDAFKGVLSGEFHGDTARFLKGGGAQSGFFSHSPEDARKVADALQRTNAFAIRSDHVVQDISRLVGQALTLKPIEAIGERIELAPRVAAMRMAEKSGSTAQQAVLAGRTVTIDFSTGGTWAKVLNQVIPFFNVATQAGAQLPRAFAENPRGFVTTATGLLAAPTVAMEAWNRSDPQRAKDYADVPQYVKDAGFVFMLPTPAQTDAKGNRKPQYAFFPTREYSPFVVLTREAAGRAMGTNPRDWADLLIGTGKGVSPVSGNSAADAASTFVPLGVSTAVQLTTNQDWFRGSKIVSQSADEQASAFSKAASEALNKMGMQTHPSAIEFTARDLGAGVAGMALAGSDMAAGKARQDERVQSTPGAGGLIGRFLQDRTGEVLNRALEQTVSPSVEKALKDAGVPTPTLPYEIRIKNEMTGNLSPPMEIHQDERAAYQKIMADRLSERLAPLLAQPGWAARSIDSRNKVLEVQVKAAREYAEGQIYRAMKPEDRQARMAAGREALKVKPKP